MVATEGDEGSISIYDSLKPRPQSEGKDFLAQHAVTVCLVRPMAVEITNHSPLIAHFNGLIAMVKSFSNVFVRPNLANKEFGPDSPSTEDFL